MAAATPGAAAIAFGAAAASTGALTFGLEFRNSRQQQQADREAISLNEAQAKLNAAEASLQSVTNFRKALASQTAIASLRGGSGSVMRQFTSEAVSNFMQDQMAISRGLALNKTQADVARRGAKVAHRARTIGAFSRFASTALMAANFGMIGSAKPPAGGTTPPTTAGGAR